MVINHLPNSKNFLIWILLLESRENKKPTAAPTERKQKSQAQDGHAVLFIVNFVIYDHFTDLGQCN